MTILKYASSPAQRPFSHRLNTVAICFLVAAFVSGAATVALTPPEPTAVLSTSTQTRN